MSLNLGQAATDAIRTLRAAPEWRIFVDGLRDTTSAKLHASLECAPENRIDQTAYARCMSDLVVALEAATKGVHARAVVKPGLKGADA